MTSESRTTFVFIQLPDTGELVVVGRYALESTRGGPLGRFVYGKSYLDRANAIALDPENLPLTAREYTTVKNNGMFGVLRDAAPDYWGRMVIDRSGRVVLDELDYLLATTDVRVGALSFAPDPAPPALNYEGVLSMDQLSSAAQAASDLEGVVEGGEPLHGPLHQLLHLSSPMGGARPKAVVLDAASQLWIAKFPARADRWVNATVEAAWLDLAAMCGIRVPPTEIIRIGDARVLLVRRFDQEPSGTGTTRRPFISAYSLFDLDDQVSDRRAWSYLEFAQLVRKVSGRPQEDSRELFRRAVFNALTSNLDDHPRNHAMLMEAATWRLSPAYDLTPSRASSLDFRELAMICGLAPGRDRWANRANLVSGCGYFGIGENEAQGIIATMKDIVLSNWEGAMTGRGATAQDRANISHAIVSSYPGFEYPAT